MQAEARPVELCQGWIQTDSSTFNPFVSPRHTRTPEPNNKWYTLCVLFFFFFFTSPLSCWSVVGTVSSVTMTLMGSYDVASLGICSCCLQAEELWHTMSLLISVFTNYHPAILYLLYIGFLGVLDTHFMTAWAMNITRKGKAFYFGIFFMILLANSRFEGACSLNLTLSIHVQLLICQKDQIYVIFLSRCLFYAHECVVIQRSWWKTGEQLVG